MRGVSLALRTLIVLVLAGCQPEADGRDDFPLGASGLALHKAQRPHSCDGDLLPMSVSPIGAQCCQLGEFIWHLSPRNGGVAMREAGKACSAANGDTNCTSDCVFGPCGARIVSITGSAPSHVFKPRSDPSVCGWQAGGAAGAFDPEPYTDQELWADVTSTCPFTSCLSGGIPAITLTVTAVADTASGRVDSKPAGIDFAGDDTQALQFAETRVKLRATPLGRHARAVFSGDCEKTGEYGEEAHCKLELGPDKSVTVTYQCKPGFSCPQP